MNHKGKKSHRIISRQGWIAYLITGGILALIAMIIHLPRRDLEASAVIYLISFLPFCLIERWLSKKGL